MTNPLLGYGEWIAETPADWPAEAWESARRQFIDVIAVMIPGACEPVTRRVLGAAGGWGDGGATIVGLGKSLAPPWAALVNGTAAHALDFDDNFDPAKAHATAVLAPALLALGEARGASGRETLDAYVTGLQILGRVGQGVNPAHRNRGWHATATLGAIGAAAACARLLKLDSKQSAYALGIATSLAGGFMSQFGSMTKPVHAGFAAKSGIVAACLAEAGIDAGLETLDGPHGMNRLMVGPDYETLRDNLVHIEHGQNLRFETASIGAPLLILSSGFRVKRFPNCGSAHRAMDALLFLIDEHRLAASEIESIHVEAPASHLANLMYERPTSGLESKFSLEHGLALILSGRGGALADYEDEAARDPDLQRLYELVCRVAVDKAEGEFPTRVTVRTTDGRSLSRAQAMPVGSLAAPFSLAQYRAKFSDLGDGLLTPDEAAALGAALDRFLDLESLAPLMRPLAGPFPCREASPGDKAP